VFDGYVMSKRMYGEHKGVFSYASFYFLKDCGGLLMNIVIAPDSFKGSLTANEVASTIGEAFFKVIPDANISLCPMADGGEGTVDVFVSNMNGRKKQIEVLGPLLEPAQTYVGVIDEKTAVMEVANIVGLTMIPPEKRNPLCTSTYGVGQAILGLLDEGIRKIIIGLGGSATSDGGLGMLQALGMTCLNQRGESVSPIANSLGEISEISLASLDPRLQECEIMIASDVTNPLLGKEGAAAVFGPQKGATPNQVIQLEEGLQNFAKRIERLVGAPFHQQPGAGAAGGLGFALLVLGAKMRRGAEVVAKAVGLSEKIEGADWVITGEGKTDYQTIYGKVPIYVAQLAKRANTKALLLSGSIQPDCQVLYDYFVSLHAAVRRPLTLDQAINGAKDLLFEASYDLARLLRLTGK
jgi:glycerate kinase